MFVIWKGKGITGLLKLTSRHCVERITFLETDSLKIGSRIKISRLQDWWTMSGQYIFELQFKGLGNRENQYVIMDKTSISDFSKLREDLSKCTPEPFLVQYLDDDDDIVSVDTEDEFKEFSKLVKERSSKGMLLKLIINSNPLTDQLNYFQPPLEQSSPEDKFELFSKLLYKTPKNVYQTPMEQNKVEAKDKVENLLKKVNFTECDRPTGTIKKQATEQTRNVETLQNEADQGAVIQTQHDMTVNTPEDMIEWKLKMKMELKEEILSEMKNHLEATRQVTEVLEDLCMFDDIDSDGNAIPVENNSRQRRLQNKCYKKLEKKEKFESKIDQRLEMLELKKKKILEKASFRTVSRRPFVDSITWDVPFIMSGIATKESSSLPKRVTAGKVFLQVWHVINDGTVTWNNVELRHTWSSPGLEPDELSIKCTPLAPGQEDHITMKFKAPKIIGALTSYWHFFYQVDSTWQQFGHYVSVTGSSKMPKLPVSSAAVARSQDSNRKQKHESKTGHSRLTTEEELAPFKSDVNKKSKQGYVRFPAEQELAKLKAGWEKKVLNDTGLPAVQSSAQLRSAEIAAEMARVAATLQRSVLKPTPALSTVQTKSLAEELKNQLEHLLDSGSDSDLNVDTSEDTDPGFVFVDIPTQSPSAESAVELVNNSAEAATEVDTDTEERITSEIMKTELDKNGKELMEVINNEIGKFVQVEKNELCTFHASELQKSKETLKSNPLEFDENDKNGNTIVENTSSAQSENITTSPQAGPLPQSSGYEQSATQAQYSDLAQARRPLSFPRLDPNVQYPVFPIPVASQPQQHGMYYASHPPPYASHSQPVVFPPPTITHYAKMGNFHQLPTYQVHGSSHPMPWATPSAFHPAMPNALINPVLRQPPLGPFGPCTVQVTGVPNGTNSAPLLNPTSPSNSNEAFCPPEQPVTIQSAFDSHPVRNESAVPAPEITDDASAPQPEPQDHNKKDSPIQILPQALMDGAITVAANAYSTAWNAINTLRPKDGEATEFDPVLENNMALLAEMGFINYERNARLLKRFNNDVNQVIGVICSTGGANLEID